MITVRELTSRAAGAVCVLQLEGERCFEAVRTLSNRAALEPGEVFATSLSFEGEALDEALVLVRSNRLVELHLHGSPPLVAQLMVILRQHFGASVAGPPRRLESRAEARVGQAPCSDGARILLDQAAGSLRRALEAILHLPDATARTELGSLLRRGERAQFVLRPAVCVLAGPVNAGKSTLFNLLVGEDRALTSDLAGTTRDLVRARGQLGPWPVEWIDTAGERGLSGAGREEEIEREGQQLSRTVLSESDLCFWLAPSGTPEPDLPAGVSICRLETFDDQGSSAAGISVPTDPVGAARIVLERFEAALGLEQPAWTAGEAVPFEPEQLEVLEQWIALDAADRVSAIREWLGKH